MDDITCAPNCSHFHCSFLLHHFHLLLHLLSPPAVSKSAVGCEIQSLSLASHFCCHGKLNM